MMAAAPVVAAVLLAVLAAGGGAARSHADLMPASRKPHQDIFNRPLKRDESSSQPYLDSSSSALANQQQSEEDDDVVSSTADHHRYTNGHTVLSKPPAPGSFIPSNCSMCVLHEEMRRLSKKKIQEDILLKLGMRHAPNITGRSKPKIPPLERLIENFGMQGDQPYRFQPGESYHDEDDFHAKTTMVIVVAQTIKLRHMKPELEIQHFPLSEQSIRNAVADATLFIHLPRTRGKVLLEVYKVLGNATEHESMTVLHASSSKLSEHREDGWVELDVKKVLQDWFKHPRSNLGIIIKVVNERNTSEPYRVDAVSSNGDVLQPFVKISTMDIRKYRSRRTIGLNCDEKSKESRCCRYPLTVDFDEYGWDWIIAPRTIESHYCSGDCPLAFLTTYPHTQIVQQANPSGKLGPCCAARKLSPVTMLYFDELFNIVYSELPDVVVERCGCY